MCSEITLPTGIDKDGRDRTAVCCLSSLNLEKYNEWKDDPDMIGDVMRFLDNVLSDFINKAPDQFRDCLLYTSPSPRDLSTSRMPSSA